MQRKTLATIEWKADKPGAFRATFATLAPVVDHDKDVTLPGAFKNGQKVIISAYGHASWEGALPVGTGAISSNASKAWVDGQFFMDTTAGKETHGTVKALGPLAEFSYGYEVLDASFDPAELAAYPEAKRILKKLDVFEVSPVLKGAGIGTGLDFIKSRPAVAKVSAPVSAEALKKMREDLELRQIWLECEARKAAADDERKTIDYVEVSSSAVDPVIHRVANLVITKACADLGVHGLDIRWFEPQPLDETIARKVYALNYGREPSEDDCDAVAESFRDEPIRGKAFTSRKQIWLRAGLGLWSAIETASHETLHAARPDLDHEQVYAYGEQWVAAAKGLVNGWDAHDENIAARQIIEALEKAIDPYFGFDPNLTQRLGQQRPRSIGYDDGRNPLAGVTG